MHRSSGEKPACNEIENSARKGEKYPLSTSASYSHGDEKSETTKPSKTSDCQIQSLPGHGNSFDPSTKS